MGSTTAYKVTRFVLDGSLLSQASFSVIVGETTSIKDVSLVGLRFSDGHPADLALLLNISSLDNVTVDPALFNHYAAEFNAFDALPGNTVTVVPEPSALALLAIGAAAFVLVRGRPPFPA